MKNEFIEDMVRKTLKNVVNQFLSNVNNEPF